jgi:hypothetical protein
MPPANLIEDIMGRKSAAALHIFHALPDGLMHVGTSSYIKQALIRFRILYYSFRFTFNCKNNRALIFLGLRRNLWVTFGIGPITTRQTERIESCGA